MRNVMTKESFIAYISKLNDRNLQRKRESGFTVWAIMGVIAVLVLDLIDKVIVIYSSIDIKFFFIIFSGLSILCISILLAIFSLSMGSSTFKTRRFYTTTDSKSFLMLYVPIFVILLIFTFINFKAARLATTINISPLIFWAFVLFFTFNAIYPFIIKLYQIRKSKKIKLPYPELSIFSNRMKLFLSILYSIISIIILIFLYLTFRDISLPLTDQQISLLVKTNVEILGFFYSL